MHASKNSQEILTLDDLTLAQPVFANGAVATLAIPFSVSQPLAFDIRLVVEIRTAAGDHLVYTGDNDTDGERLRWLPRGEYSLDWMLPQLNFLPGHYHIEVVAHCLDQRQLRECARQLVVVEIQGEASESQSGRAHWHFSSRCQVQLEQLPWQHGHDNWFFRHFDHAAHVIIDYMLDNSPLLSGKILDVGCGDGITDMGVYLRTQPELLVGIDPDKAYQRLPEVLKENQIEVELPANLIHTPDDANHIPYPDDYFDVVISWGSVEHIAGGYLQTLSEIRRVLRPDGLLFIHPGLYFGNYGHHLGEFSSEPFFHLTKSEEEIKDLVLNTKPELMDRSGYEHVSPEDFWRYYQELNPITVSQFEQELRALDFEFFRAALRTEGRIEYNHPKLQDYPVQDLSTLEFYLSAYNRKTARPAGFSTDPREENPQQ